MKRTMCAEGDAESHSDDGSWILDANGKRYEVAEKLRSFERKLAVAQRRRVTSSRTRSIQFLPFALFGLLLS